MKRVMKNKLLFCVLAILSSTSTAALACDDGHWVQSVSGDGSIVILEDGSVWQVSPIDAIDSMLWLPTTEIMACDDKLINTDDGETVDAIRIR